MRRIPRKLTISLCLLIFAGASAYWFFMHTNRGSSWALYAVAGLRAPLSVKISCARSTDARVAEKFQLPLAFTEDAKDSLRGFWYYDYYRECLFSHGYDFSGNPVPASTLDGERYVNTYAGFGFLVPDGLTITRDNALDVDDDDRLHTSLISGEGVSIMVSAYAQDDTRRSLDSVERIGPFWEPITTRISSASSAGVGYDRMTDTAGRAAIAFRTPTDWTVFVTASSDPGLLSSIADSLALLQ